MQMFGHIGPGAVECLLILLAISYLTTWLDRMSDRAYGCVIIATFWLGGLIGIAPDLIGYGLAGDHNWDMTNPVAATLMGGHYPIDWLYLQYGIEDGSMLSNVYELLTFILSGTVMLAAWGLSDVALLPGEEATLKRSIRRGWAHLSAVMRGRR